MAVSSYVANQLAMYRTGEFGFGDIDMNAVFENSDTTWLEADTDYTPPITGRNTQQWSKVYTDGDWVYDNTKMFFPLPKIHYENTLVEVEFGFEGLFKPPTSNSQIAVELRFFGKVNGSWVRYSTYRTFGFGVAPPSVTNINLRECHYVKTFWIRGTDYDPVQFAIQPIIRYSAAQQFRIDDAYMRVLIRHNDVG